MSLDLGCGSGGSKGFIESFGWEWIGLDLQFSKNLSILADAHILPFRERVFGMVVCFSALEHFEDPWKVLREVCRVLKDDCKLIGVCAFLEPHSDSYFHFSRSGLRKMLSDCGFLLEEVTPGWHILEVIMHDFLPSGLFRFGRKLARLLARLHFKFGLIYLKNRAKSLDQKQKIDSFTESDYSFRFAGSIVFKAKKL